MSCEYLSIDIRYMMWSIEWWDHVYVNVGPCHASCQQSLYKATVDIQNVLWTSPLVYCTLKLKAILVQYEMECEDWLNCVWKIVYLTCDFNVSILYAVAKILILALIVCNMSFIISNTYWATICIRICAPNFNLNANFHPHPLSYR